MKIYKKNNVFEEALERIRFLFDEFEEVWVSFSGGKDSTVIYNLAKIVAREKGKLPLKVVFLDQEAEYEHTIELVREIMYDEDVEPYWIQVPIKLFNATSTQDEWLLCWDEDNPDKWIREKDPISYKENHWGTDRFADFFLKFMNAESKARDNMKMCYLTGVRTEESPSRYIGLTTSPTYKWITWGKKNQYNKNTFSFHPIYDWSYTDVWKAIHDNGWDYNKIYDYQYQHGVRTQDMRVSNLHHETAVHHLFFLQEVEPDTYQRLTQRVKGMDTAGKLGRDDYFVTELPFMFKDWKEYRDYLLEKLITNEEHREKMRKDFHRTEKKYIPAVKANSIYKTHISIILTNDYHGTKLGNAENRWRLQLRDYERERKRNAMAKRKAKREQRQK